MISASHLNNHNSNNTFESEPRSDKPANDSEVQSTLSSASLDSQTPFVNNGLEAKIFTNFETVPSVLNNTSQALNSIFSSKVVMSSPGTLDLNTELPQNNITSAVNQATTAISNSNLNQSVAATTTSATTVSTPLVKNGKRTTVVKRKYSRNGCTECKRRRMKCDETKPVCWQCSRLNRECVYILNAKNKKRKATVKGSLSSGGKELLKDNKRAVMTPTSNARTPIDINEKPSLLMNNNVVSMSSDKVIDTSNMMSSNKMDGFDANLLMQNLNDIVSMKLNDSVMLNGSLENYDFHDLDIPDLLPNNPTNVSSVPISFLVNNVIQFNIKLSSFRLGGIHDRYLAIFYNDCLNSIAPFFQDQGNPLRDILLSFARNESYLLSAILAIGASIAHRKSNKLEDERIYCAYLSHCLNLLGDQFHNESNVLNKIEPIILTIILLAWDCIYTMNSQWRSHLRGVTDLFKKINSGSSSKVLNVAKCWFKVIETFASISTVLGGSLTNDDIDYIFDPYDFQYVDSLKFLNIMTPLNEFNLLRGHKEDLDLVIREVIKSLNSIRASEKKESASNENMMSNRNIDYLLWTPNHTRDRDPISYFKTQKILVELDRQLEYEFISKTGIIPKSSQSHPDNSHIDDNAIDIVTLRDGERVAISWYDISHQTQTLSFLLIVLLKLLGIPRESTAIQQVVKRIMSFFFFVDSEDPPQNARTCYSNFAVLLAGLNAMDEDTRDLVRKYFKLNRGSSRRLTEHNLNRLEKVWSGTEKDYKLADQDVLTW